MDDSDTRRGMPAAHRAFASAHTARGWDGDEDRFGLAGAVLAGNLCLTWTDAVYATCGLPEEDLARGRPVFDLMRTQLMAGQFLDVVESMRPWDGLPATERVERAERVIRYKSAKYSVEHPLLIGATTGWSRTTPGWRRSRATGSTSGGRSSCATTCSASSATRRRPGSRPATTCARASAPCCSPTPWPAWTAGSGRVESLLGRPTSTPRRRRLRDTIEGSGAVARLEEEIADSRCRDELLDGATSLDPEARAALLDLVGITTARTA